jgi:putative radical SAM enzyme (TIGR03279 family)
MEIVSIDGEPVGDQLDVLFRAPQEGSALFGLRGRGTTRLRRVSAEALDRARLVFEPMRFARCRSRCIFCFMDQMPPGMRASLYEKDDDYRLSFLFGNYVTLTNATEEEIRRIIELGLSPIYISVHAVRASVRRRIFGVPVRRYILRDMRRLARHGITMHAQVVIVPGVNDGRVLEETVARLAELYPACRSIALVPVGLTKHRRRLPAIRPVTSADARAIIRWAECRRRELHEKTGEHVLHLADELYLLAGRALPPEEAYDDFPQLANGVGMCRMFLRDLRRDAARLDKAGAAPTRITIVTGWLAARFMRREVMPLLRESAPRLSIDLLVVPNRLFGRSVGVSGLLSGEDILRAALARGRPRRCLVLPPNALNHAGQLLDCITPAQLERSLGVPVVVPHGTFLERRVLRRCREGCAA